MHWGCGELSADADIGKQWIAAITEEVERTLQHARLQLQMATAAEHL